MTIPILRPYQDRAVAASRQHVLEGRKRVILALPTAGGKAVIAASIITSARRNFDAKILFVAARIELIDQAVEHLAQWGVTEVGVIRADDKRSAPLMPIQIASVQTLARRPLWFTPNIVLHDECHHCISPSWLRIFDLCPDAVHIGFSATPIPMGRASGGPFDALEIAATYVDLIADGFIAEPRCFSTPAKPDLSSIHTVDGDYNLGELEEVMIGESLVGGIYERWKELSESRKTVIFATGVRHSQAIVQQFQENSVRAAHIDANTPADVRAEIGRKLHDGELEVVSNVGIYTEGWNAPWVKCIVLARPTKSFVLYKQTVGRGLRVWNGIVPFVLDHAGNFDRHGAPHEDYEWKLDAPPRRVSEGKFRVCPRCYAYIAAHLRECPHCQHVFVTDIRPLPTSVDVPLVERMQAADPRRRDFDKFVDDARRKGYKPTYASVKYKEKYGSWPPWSWKNHAQAMYEADLQWQNKLTHNETWRARRSAERAEEERPTEDKLMELADEMMKEWDA